MSRHGFTTPWLPFAAIALLLWGCDGETQVIGETGVVLRIDAESETRAALADVRLLVFKDTGGAWTETTRDVIAKSEISDWPIEIPIRPGGGACTQSSRCKSSPGTKTAR